MPPHIFNFWCCLGVGISSVILWLPQLTSAKPLVFSPWGLVSGALFTASCACAMAAISTLGLAVASGVWCGTAVLVSFAFGVTVAGEPIARMSLAAWALADMLMGIAGIGAASVAASMAASSNAPRRVATGIGHAAGAQVGGAVAVAADEERGPSLGQALLQGYGAAAQGSDESAGHEAGQEGGWEAKQGGRGKDGGVGPGLVPGLLLAVLTGLCGGLILAPMSAAPAEAQGTAYVPPWAWGSCSRHPHSRRWSPCCCAPLLQPPAQRMAVGRAAGSASPKPPLQVVNQGRTARGGRRRSSSQVHQAQVGCMHELRACLGCWPA